jgi:hypothetical protein
MSSNAEETMAASTYRLTGDALAAANSPESSPVTLPHRPKPGPETEEMKLVPWDESDLDDYGNYDEEVDFGKPEPVKSGDPGEPGEETKPKPKKKKKKSKKSGKGKVCVVQNVIAKLVSLMLKLRIRKSQQDSRNTTWILP